MNYIYIRAYFYVFDGQNCFIVEFIDAFSTKICPFTLPLRKIIKSMKIEIKNKIGNRRGGGVLLPLVFEKYHLQTFEFANGITTLQYKTFPFPF